MHNGFQVMHYQIYRFTGYLLVHLTVPDFFWAKIYPNLPCAPQTHPLSLFSRLANICPCQLLERRHRNLEMAEALCTLCSSYPKACGVSALLLQQQLRKLRAHLHAVQEKSVRQTSLSSFFSNNLSPMDVNTIKYTVLLSFRLTTYSDFGSVTFLVEVTNNHTLWHISSCIRCHNA